MELASTPCRSRRASRRDRQATIPLPRLTIGLTVHNGENFLAESIGALLGQTRAPKLRTAVRDAKKAGYQVLDTREPPREDHTA